MRALIASVRFAYTIRCVRGALQCAGLDGSRDVSAAMYCGAPEFVIAAALARSTVGA